MKVIVLLVFAVVVLVGSHPLTRNLMSIISTLEHLKTLECENFVNSVFEDRVYEFKYLCKVSDILKKDSDCKFSEKEKIMRELQQISNHSKTNCTEELENMSLSNTTILMKNLMRDLSKWAKTMLFRNGLDSKET